MSIPACWLPPFFQQRSDCIEAPSEDDPDLVSIPVLTGTRWDDKQKPKYSMLVDLLHPCDRVTDGSVFPNARAEGKSLFVNVDTHVAEGDLVFAIGDDTFLERVQVITGNDNELELGFDKDLPDNVSIAGWIMETDSTAAAVESVIKQEKSRTSPAPFRVLGIASQHQESQFWLWQNKVRITVNMSGPSTLIVDDEFYSDRWQTNDPVVLNLVPDTPAVLNYNQFHSCRGTRYEIRYAKRRLRDAYWAGCIGTFVANEERIAERDTCTILVDCSLYMRL